MSDQNIAPTQNQAQVQNTPAPQQEAPVQEKVSTQAQTIPAQTAPIPAANIPKTMPPGEDPSPADAEAVLKKTIDALKISEAEKEDLKKEIPKIKEEVKGLMAEVEAAKKEKRIKSIMDQLMSEPGLNQKLVTPELIEKGIFPEKDGVLDVEALRKNQGLYMPDSPTYYGQPLPAAPPKMDINYWLKQDYRIDLNTVSGGK